MRHMRWISGLIFSAILFSGTLAAEEWQQLFNGKDLTGWTPKLTGEKLGEDKYDTFRVENGVIKVAYDKYSDFGNHFGHLFYAKPYSNYILRIEYRFT
ncbi:MAG: DUF1080 domain-containing protein, partial [Isosphaeraceae bacterium]